MRDRARHAWPDAVEALIEVPRGAHVKRGTGLKIDFVSPFPSPFNYGSVPGLPGGDGEAQDVLVLGPALPLGERVHVALHGIVGFMDGGLNDDKLIAGRHPPSHADVVRMNRFFRNYARAKAALRLFSTERATRFEGVFLW